MATIQRTQANTNNRTIRAERWASMAQNDEGADLPFAVYSDRSVQVAGVFGGATVVFEGSNDGGSTWATLSDPWGNPLSFTAAGLKQITSITLLARPRVAGGDGTTDINVSLCGKEPA